MFLRRYLPSAADNACNSARDCGSRYDVAACASPANSLPNSVAFPSMLSSVHLTTEARTVAGRASVASQAFAPADRPARPAGSSSTVAVHSAARRAATKQARATSRAPPIGARPARLARCLKRNTGAEMAKGGRVGGTVGMWLGVERSAITGLEYAEPLQRSGGSQLPGSAVQLTPEHLTPESSV